MEKAAPDIISKPCRLVQVRPLKQRVRCVVCGCCIAKLHQEKQFRQVWNERDCGDMRAEERMQRAAMVRRLCAENGKRKKKKKNKQGTDIYFLDHFFYLWLRRAGAVFVGRQVVLEVEDGVWARASGMREQKVGRLR